MSTTQCSRMTLKPKLKFQCHKKIRIMLTKNVKRSSYMKSILKVNIIYWRRKWRKQLLELLENTLVRLDRLKVLRKMLVISFTVNYIFIWLNRWGKLFKKWLKLNVMSYISKSLFLLSKLKGKEIIWSKNKLVSWLKDDMNVWLSKKSF